MNISDFVAQIGDGLARTNRYDIVLTAPPSIDIAGIIPGQQLAILCEQVQLPGLSINTAPIRTFGEVRETPYEFNYEPINMSFYVDNKMGVKIFFDKWIKSIQNGTERTFAYYTDYICPQIDIYVQDTLDNDRYLVRLYEAYPKSVGVVQMDYASKDVMKLTVQMVFKHWRASEESFDVVSQPSGAQIKAGQSQEEIYKFSASGLQIKAPPVKSEVNIKNPYMDPKLPFGLPGLPSSMLKIPNLSSFF
jgi:hypothetical protein